MLSVEQLYVNYGEKEILHDVDLQVAQEEIVMIVGESGSGKSTLVRSIMGLLGEEGHITKLLWFFSSRRVLLIPLRPFILSFTML